MPPNEKFAIGIITTKKAIIIIYLAFISYRDEQAGPSPLAMLTPELITYICGFLDILSLCSLSLVCSYLRQIADAEPWQRYYASLIGPVECLSLSDAQKARGSNYWKDHIVQARIVQRSWESGGTQHSLQGHYQSIKYLQFIGNRLFTSDDTIMKEWDLSTLSMKDSFTSSSQCVTFRFNEKQLVISGNDAVRVYDVNSKEFLFALPSTFSIVTCVMFNQQRIVAGSWDGYVKVYATTNGGLLQTMVGHHNPVYCISTHENAVVSGSSDKSVKLWDLDSTACVTTLRGHGKTVNTLQLNKQAELVVSGGRDNLIKVWDLRAGACVSTLYDHSDAVTCLQFNGFKIVSGSKDRLIKVWDLRTGRWLYSLEGHTAGINCLQFSTSLIVSGGDDKALKVWEFPG
jgi:WD40 repeat protein